MEMVLTEIRQLKMLFTYFFSVKPFDKVSFLIILFNKANLKISDGDEKIKRNTIFENLYNRLGRKN